MENKHFNKITLLSIAVGVWIIVLQNFNVFKGEESATPVNIVNTVDVKGSVDVEGTVDVGNTVDINISAVNGYGGFYDHGGNGKYNRIPVYGGN